MSAPKKYPLKLRLAQYLYMKESSKGRNKRCRSFPSAKDYSLAGWEVQRYYSQDVSSTRWDCISRTLFGEPKKIEITEEERAQGLDKFIVPIWENARHDTLTVEQGLTRVAEYTVDGDKILCAAREVRVEVTPWKGTAPWNLHRHNLWVKYTRSAPLDECRRLEEHLNNYFGAKKLFDAGEYERIYGLLVNDPEMVMSSLRQIPDRRFVHFYVRMREANRNLAFEFAQFYPSDFLRLESIYLHYKEGLGKREIPNRSYRKDLLDTIE